MLYLIVQATWGLPQTLAGLIVLAAHAQRPRFHFHGAIVTIWNSRKAMSLGPFIFIGKREANIDAPNGSGQSKGSRTAASDGRPKKANGSQATASLLDKINRPLLVHEYGHTVQSLILGPAYLLVIGAPSVIWLNLPAFSKRRHRRSASYYSFYTERSANWLGEKVLKEASIGQAFID